MHTRNLIALLAGSFLLAGNALADRPGSDWISIEDGVDGMDQLEASVGFLRRKLAQHWPEG